jgi:hypothetical protein
MSDYLVRPWEETRTFPCADCGKQATRIAGELHRDGACRAVYRMTWVPSHPEVSAHLALGIGPWNEGASRTDRQLVELRVWHVDRYPSLAVVDSPSHPEFESVVLGVGLRRDQVVGTALAPVIFAMTDHAMFHDPRILAYLRTERWPR